MLQNKNLSNKRSVEVSQVYCYIFRLQYHSMLANYTECKIGVLLQMPNAFRKHKRTLKPYTVTYFAYAIAYYIYKKL